MMKKQTNKLMAALMLLALLGISYSQGTQRANAAPNSVYFAETNQTVKGRFLEYWQQHGGLAQQGYPISGEMQEKSDLNGKTYTVQYFERSVFELHTENIAPNDVLLTQLGTLQYQQKYGAAGASGQRANPENARQFSQTGKQIGGAFRTYWEQHGGLAQQGLPISNEFVERSDLNGKTYTVQYFERAVFEYHDENRGTPTEVLLSQLGTFRHNAKTAPVAQATTAPAAPAYRSSLSDNGLAPEISSDTWLNTPNGAPLTLASQHGKVVVVEFWTFSCINCIHATPGLVKLYNDLKDSGLQVIGVHSPEFSYEHDASNVKTALAQYNITYPVPLDNDFKNWRAYNNSFWPAQYVIDKHGHIRGLYIGEGQETNVRNAVQDLLKEN